jgi:protein TonB
MAFIGALIIACVIHFVLLNNLTLTASIRKKPPELMDVTLISKRSNTPSKKSNVLATENQQQDSSIKELSEKHNEIPRHEIAVDKTKPIEPMENIAHSNNNHTHGDARIVPPIKEVKKQNAPTKPDEKQEKITIASKPAPEKNIKEKKAGKETIVEETPEKPHLSPELLQQQIAQIGSAVRDKQFSRAAQRIKFIDAVNASKYVAAQYLHDWEVKVERTGNMNYPQIAGQKNFSGTLIMDVGIKLDGTIYSIRINQSSGNPDLDEAAKKIVRMSAPFAPLPIELQKELDVLVITRVWRFSDYAGLTTE